MGRIKKVLRITLCAAAFAASCAVSAIYFPINMSSEGDEDTVAVVTETPTPEPKPNLAALGGELDRIMADCSGDWSLFFEDYASGERISLNNHRVYSASLVKLYVIQAVYNEIAAGSLSDSGHIEELLSRMITWSDNEAWRELARLLGGGSYMGGMEVVTRVARDEGFFDSGQFMEGGRSNFNFTSVEDCGNYLRRVLDGTIVNAEYSAKILGLLERQQVTHKIPAGVPEGVMTANKTGELEYLEGDAAIVYAPNGIYILVVIAQDMDDPGVSQTQIRNISSYIYDYTNPG